MTSVHQLMQPLHYRTVYPLYLTDRILDNTRKVLARLFKKKLKALLERRDGDVTADLHEYIFDPRNEFVGDVEIQKFKTRLNEWLATASASYTQAKG